MLDVIKTKGEPRAREYFLVYDTNLPQFTQRGDGNYEAHNLIVVAAVNYGPSGQLFDWAAYIGLVPLHWSQEAKLETVASYGNKLTEREVEFYLYRQPNINGLIKRYRE